MNTWISYTDSEVNCFHPICESALNIALHKIGKDTQYKVLHHQRTGNLEMDYVIQNISTGKYLCVVEVKRTPADVRSTRYQFQTMSYVQMNTEQSEQPYYILTNLEYALAFRYDATKPKVFQQILEPGLSHIGNFNQIKKDDFIENLAEYFKDNLNNYINDSHYYLVTLENFAHHMEQIKNNSKQWKTTLAVFLYEYIRGAFSSVNRKELKDVRLFQNNIAQICEEALHVNFKDIFNYSEGLFEKNVTIDNTTLKDLYNFGNQNVNGDIIVGILHSIVSAGHEHDGEVPTDLELARIVAELAKYSSGELLETDIICDPAAGSGNLISAVIPTYNIQPKQIIVNDINKKLLELLSLRLGLNYAKIINPENSPTIYNHGLADIDTVIFDNVKVIVMNPPFSAGINCKDHKIELYDRIENLTNKKAITKIGQMPLEVVFLELLIELLRPGTTICCVFPSNHLLGRGDETKIIRKLLLEQFGLHLIFTYPRDEIFDDVTKDTCIIVGKAKTLSKNIKIISSYDKIPNIDISMFSNMLKNNVDLQPNKDEFISMMPGIVIKHATLNELAKKIDDGWRILNSEIIESINFIDKIFTNTDQFVEFGNLNEQNYKIKRGTVGNKGGSDILFFDSRADLYEQFIEQKVILSSGMRNATLDCFEIGTGDSKFLNIFENTEELINNIIDVYSSLPSKKGKQQRFQKTNQELKELLTIASKDKFPANSVLIPRAIRATGKIYLARESIFVSTNFVVCSLPTLDEAILLSTWMNTIFYQLICEVSSKNQEGMRKMEERDIKKTYVPNFKQIRHETLEKLSSAYHAISFLNLVNPVIRDIDIIWANELFGENANELLNESKRLLTYLVNRRTL